MNSKSFSLTSLGLVCLGIYLFVTAPPPLEENTLPSRSIPVERMFEILETENDAVRALWTNEIVGEGKQTGLRFDEHWRDADVEAGPLPALFLREVARSLESKPVQLSLFLGSDYPINSANLFEGLQWDRFQTLRRTQKPQYFFMADIGRHVAMYPDVAISQVCVQCHNEHEQATKTDWRLNDVMGATTWMYSGANVSPGEMIQVINALYSGFQEAYQHYLDKVQSFSTPPLLGEHWPREGYFLPTTEVFMQEVLRRTAPQTLTMLGSLIDQPPSHGEEKNHENK